MQVARNVRIPGLSPWLVASALVACALAPMSSLAHVTLAPEQARVGARYAAVLQVPHGCKGSPTVRLRVRIPEGVLDVRPVEKDGWTVDIEEGGYTTPQVLEGRRVNRGVREMRWSGGPLLDKEDAEFAFSAHLSETLPANTTLHFPVVQECLRGVERWIDIPAEGSMPAADHSDSPAPGVRLLPAR